MTFLIRPRTARRCPAGLAVCAAVLGLATPVHAVSEAPAPSLDVRPTIVTGLVAEHVIRDAEDGSVLELRRVETSVHGMRITSMGLHEGEPYAGTSQLLANQTLERMWLIDRARRLVHPVPLVASDDAGADEDRPSPPGEVFARAPCDGLVSIGSTASTWRGRAVDVHDCADATQEVRSSQAFDAAAGIVVRVVPKAGPIQEVRAIRAVPLGPERFLPGDSLRETDLEEFLSGPSPLARYEPG